MPSRPNVVFILSDQHNAKVLGCKGHPDVQTPNLDRMAAEGVRFDNAVTQNPICTPSRVSWLSGQYCHNHGYYGLCGSNPNGLPNLLGHFRSAGYASGAVGKIHCPEYWVEDSSDFFREATNCSIGGNPEYQAYLRERGVWDAWNESERARGPFGQCMDGFPSKQTYRDSPEGWVVTESVGFMRRAQEAGKPFCLHVSFPKPHQVYCPAQEFWDLYDEEKISLPPNADYEMEGKAPHLRETVEGFRNTDWFVSEPRTYEAGRRRKLRGYLGCVSHVDHAVGEILDFLREAGLDEDTIVVYSSDHGDYATEHGIIEKAPGICADAITRIPMIWRSPDRLAAGHVAEELVETVDLVNTLCSLAGLPPMHTADGFDISHLLRGESGQVRDVAVTEFAWTKSVRKGDWRLVHYQKEMFPEEYPEGFGELYNLAKDPWEMKNLFFESEHQDKVVELQRDLLQWTIRTTRPKTVLPDVRTDAPQFHTRYRCSTLPDGKIGYSEVRGSHHRMRNYI